MTQNQQLNVQCFVKKPVQPLFTGENTPKLLYVGEIRPDASAHPRIMHAHEDFVEIILIYSGLSEYLIHNKKQNIQQGDLLIYNAGIVHDEVSGPDVEIGSYCIAVGNLHMPGLRPNALLPDDAGYVFPTGQDFHEIRLLCEMMFHNLASGQPRAEAVCHSLMHALLLKVLTAINSKPDTKSILDEPHALGYQIKDYIDKHYMKPITLQSIGEAQTLLNHHQSTDCADF